MDPDNLLYNGKNFFCLQLEHLLLKKKRNKRQKFFQIIEIKLLLIRLVVTTSTGSTEVLNPIEHTISSSFWFKSFWVPVTKGIH